MTRRVVLIERVCQLLACCHEGFLHLEPVHLKLVEAIGRLLEQVRNLGRKLGWRGFRGIHIGEVGFFHGLACDGALVGRGQVLHDELFLKQIPTTDC